MIWLKNTWYVAAFEHELEETTINRKLLGENVIIYRTSEGETTALQDLCPHRLMPLSVGKRIGDELQCGYHGMKFNAQGTCTTIPGQSQIPAKACVKRFPTVLRHGFVWIWMGDPELASDTLIPDVHWNDSPDWTPSLGYHHFECDFRLMNDNLLDLSHESYVHTRTIGNEEEESIANYPLNVTVSGDRLIRAHREMPNIDPPPFFEMVLKSSNPINRWQTAINLMPGINMTDVGVYPVEKDRSQAHVMHVLHLLTPETEKSTHYFWAVDRNFDLGDEKLTQGIKKSIDDTFNEDKVILEIQQKQLDEMGGESIPNVAIRLDEAAVRARRMLDMQIQKEAEDPKTVLEPLPLLEEAEPEAAEA